MPKMPWGWGKFTSKENRKGSKDNVLDGVQPPRLQCGPIKNGGKKLQEEIASTRGNCRLSVDVSQQNSDPRSVFALSSLSSRSLSPSTPSSRCPSFNDKKSPAQPLPLPTPLGRANSVGVTRGSNSGSSRLLHASTLPPHCEIIEPRILGFDATEVEQGTSGCASYSNSSGSSLGSVDAVDSWNHGASTLSRLRPYQDTDPTDPPRHQIIGLASAAPKHSRKSSKQDMSRPSSPLGSSQIPSSSPKVAGLELKRGLPPIRLESANHRFHQLNGSAPDSSLSSPARSPRRISTSEQVAFGGVLNKSDFLSSPAQGSSPGSVHNSGHDVSGADPSHLLWNKTTQRSPEPSPLPSPRQRSPGPSGTVSPLHPRTSGTVPGAPESPTSWHEDGKTLLHPLPLPPRITSGVPPLSSPPISPTPSSSSGRFNSRGECSSGGSPALWQKGKLLGSGTFGNVYVGFNSDSGALCAMKEVLLVSDDSKSKESVKQLQQEVSLLSRLRHQNIVQYIGTEELDDRLCIYLEYVSGGSIHKLLQEYGLFKEPVIRSFTRQILAGLAYLHNMHTVHRDVKGANILVDTNGKVKLADFGMAKHITAQSFPLSFKGSPYWMAPEVIKHTNGYDLAVDIWSLGCTVLEMATAKPPWSQYEGVAAMFKIGNSKELPAIPNSLSPEGKDFVRLCLQRDPNNRPTALQLLKHPFVENLQEDKLDSHDVLATATKGVHNLVLGYRHDCEGGLPSYLLRPRGQLSPTSSDVSRQLASGYGPSNANSLSPTSQTRHHVYNGPSSLPHSPHVLSGASTPQNGGYGSPHGSVHSSAHGSSHAHLYANGNYGTTTNPFSDGYLRPSGIYGNTPIMSGGGYTEPIRCEFHWGTPHRTPEGSPRRKDFSLQNDILGMALGRVSHDSEEDAPRQFNLNGNLVEQLLRRPQQVSPILYHHTSILPPLSHTGGELSH